MCARALLGETRQPSEESWCLLNSPEEKHVDHDPRLAVEPNKGRVSKSGRPMYISSSTPARVSFGFLDAGLLFGIWPWMKSLVKLVVQALGTAKKSGPSYCFAGPSFAALDLRQKLGMNSMLSQTTAKLSDWELPSTKET